MTYPTKRLGEVIELQYGKGILKTDRKSNGLYPVYGANGVLDRTNKFLVEGEAIIVGRKGSAGELMRVSGKFWPSDVTYYVLGNKEVDIDYLFHFFKNLNLPRLAVGVKPGINRNRVYEIEIPLPPVGEQRKIVARIEKQFAKIDEAARLRAESEAATAALLPAALHEIFSQAESKGWAEKRVGEIAPHSLGKMLDKAKNKGVLQKYLRNINVRWFDFDLSDMYEMRFKDTESEKYTAVKGDVLICEGGEPGRAAIWEEDYPVYFQKAVHRVRFTKSIDPKWFLYYLYHTHLTREIEKYLTGAGIRHFTGVSLDKFTLPIPPIAEQKEIVKKLDAIAEKVRALQALQSQQTADLKALKQSILHEAFSGS